ncbi:MAG TPA: rhomboid family intramembrane serine protease, partial [bacterium]|nr:rhomboid family intramembrane serine protease [bacterium]
MFFFWPIHDEFGVKRFPFINYTIIFVNVIVYFLFGFSGNYEQIVETFGFIPARFSWLTIFTSMFLHGSIMHLVGNMWYLYLMGDNIEDRWGHFQYLVFYLFSGILASLFYGFLSFGDARTIPSIGASGAISGVLGAYLVLFPKDKITFWYYVFAIFTVYTGTFDMFSYAWISLWFIQQLIGLITSMGSTSGIAFGAHIGGFLAGMGIALLVKLIQRTRYISNIKIGKNALYDIIGSPVTKPILFEDQIELFNIEKQIKQLIKDGNFKDAAVLYGDA